MILFDPFCLLFQIEEDLIRQGGFQIMPTFESKASKLTEKDRLKNLRIAIERVHVERAIARLKIFQIFSFVRHDMYRFINKILLILSFVVNTFGPLLEDDEDQDFDKFVTELEDEDPNADNFARNDRFIANFDENDDKVYDNVSSFFW